MFKAAFCVDELKYSMSFIYRCGNWFMTYDSYCILIY